MKAALEQVSLNEQSSLLVKQLRLATFDAPWHYHPEFELTYITSSRGQRFVGDHIGEFSAGDLVLIGPNLPHVWRNESRQNPNELAEAVVVQFPPAWDETVLKTLPEAERIRHLFARARYGLRFSTVAAVAVDQRLRTLPDLHGMERVIALLTILHTLSADPDAVLLASDGFRLLASEAETERMKRVLEYILEHFRDEIRVEQIASVAGMVPAAFCRYFRRRTGKSFVEYLNGLRISHARHLLTNADLSVGQVGLECGFNNISHFHRQFRLLTGTTPFRYQARARAK